MSWVVMIAALYGAVACDDVSEAVDVTSTRPVNTGSDAPDRLALVDGEGRVVEASVRAIGQSGGYDRFGPANCVLIERTMKSVHLGSGKMAPCYEEVSSLFARYSDPSCTGDVYLQSTYPFEKFNGVMHFAVGDFDGYRFVRTQELLDVDPAFMRMPNGECAATKPASVRRFRPLPLNESRLPNPPYSVETWK